MATREHVVVVGLGLIGGSIAQALLPVADVVGVDADPGTCARAASDGIPIGTLDAVVTSDSVVIIAVPVDTIDLTFRQIAALAVDPLVTDVGSVKGTVVESARRHGIRFVGGHPMAGSERSGYEAALDSLFSGARWALVLEPDTDLEAWIRVAQLAIAVGAGVVPITSSAHDDAVGVVSHLPHVLAAALAGAAGDDDARELRLGLAAGSFRDGTRVARSPAPFWTSVLANNAEVVATLVDKVASELASVSRSLRDGDLDAVERFFADGEAVRTRFDERTGVAVTMTAADDAAVVTQLLELGRNGGYVTSIDTSGSAAVIHARVPLSDGGAA